MFVRQYICIVVPNNAAIYIGQVQGYFPIYLLSKLRCFTFVDILGVCTTFAIRLASPVYVQRIRREECRIWKVLAKFRAVILVIHVVLLLTAYRANSFPAKYLVLAFHNGIISRQSSFYITSPSSYIKDDFLMK